MGCYLLPFIVLPITWTGSPPASADEEDGDENAFHGKNDHQGDCNEDIPDDNFDGDGNDEEDDDDDGSWMYEVEPLVTLYTTKSGERIELNVEREVDTDAEWSWETPRTRWLMPTCIARGRVRGLILERKEADDGRFRRCGAFEYVSEEAKKVFWSCCLDFDGAGLERRPFNGVLKPVINRPSGTGESLVEYEVCNNVMQCVISIV